MASAFKCDSCGEYADGMPLSVIVNPPDVWKSKRLQYDLCPSCADEVIRVICKDNVYGDIK